MQRYKDYRPSNFDVSGLGLDDRQEWLVLPCGQNRDSDALSRSNFRVCLARLGGESETVEVHRFGHWACGWIEIIIIRPNSEFIDAANDIEAALEGYPVLSDEDFSELESEDANETWKNCYSWKDRIEYIRNHRSQFEFHDCADLIGCVRGHYFSGYASELLN